MLFEHAKFFLCGGFPLDLKMINRHFKMFTYGDGSGRVGEQKFQLPPIFTSKQCRVKCGRSCMGDELASPSRTPAKNSAADATRLSFLFQ